MSTVGEARVLSRVYSVSSSVFPGLSLRLREWAPCIASSQPPLLMVHGATIASVLWDNPAPGWSWMEMLARAGIPAFALDLRGYGFSASPNELPTAPFARASEAQHDVADAVAFIRALTGAERIDLLGGSWGSVVCGLYLTGQKRPPVRRLVFYAPVYSAPGEGAEWRAEAADPTDPARISPHLGPFRSISAASFLARWDAEIPLEDKTLWRDEAVAAALLRHSLAESGRRDAPGCLHMPTGALADLFEVFSGRPLYLASDIDLPTLIVRGEHDRTSTQSDAKGLFETLGSERKLYCVVGRGAHFMVGERCLPELHSIVAGFLLDASQS
ncbi:MAG: alpha/beta fold hydrolase [Kiloniellaceae bacterium]